MRAPLLSSLSFPRRKPLATCFASIFALSAPAAMAIVPTTFYVDTCDEGISNSDSTHGSLRWALTQAVSGNTIDMTLLNIGNCPTSKISLTTGDLVVPQDDLTILGPGASALTIDASTIPGKLGPYFARAFTHNGTGDLTIEDVTLTGGHNLHYGYDTLGGCVYSKGNVLLARSIVSSCSVTQGSSGYQSGGAGVFAKGNVSLKYSTLINNVAIGSSVRGGGARALGNLTVLYTTVSNNKAYGTAYGGGLSAEGGIVIAGSTISGNYSQGKAGGVDASSASPGGNTFELANSTISGNTAASVGGGLIVNSATTQFYNSTIAFNTTVSLSPGASPGVQLDSSSGALAVALQSTLMSNNTYGTVEVDLDHVGGNTITFNEGNLGTAANNLIRVASFGPMVLPTDTASGCPRLGKLRDNGGLTWTHALLSASPAIDNGNVNAGTSFNYDQRGKASINGTLDYLRPSGGLDTKPDIGAYEVQQADIVFNSDFEGCPPIII